MLSLYVTKTKGNQNSHKSLTLIGEAVPSLTVTKSLLPQNARHQADPNGSAGGMTDGTNGLFKSELLIVEVSRYFLLAIRIGLPVLDLVR